MTAPKEDHRLADHPFRGLTQTIAGVVVALLFTAIAWGFWAEIAHRRLQARIDAMTAGHEPFFNSKVPDDAPSVPRFRSIDWKPLVLDVPMTPLAPKAVDQVKAAIARLLDTSDVDRLNMCTVDQQREGDCATLMAQRNTCWLLRPMVDLAEDFVLEQRAVDRLAAAAPDAPAARMVYESHPTAMTRQFQCPNSRDPVLGIYTNSFDTMEQAITKNWIAVADRRAAALALAIRLYRAERGRWPRQAADLVPQYLAAIPPDPLMGEAIGYVVLKHALPDGGDRPMLYFNLPIDFASAKPPKFPVYSWNNSTAQWRDLIWWGPEANGSEPTGIPVIPPTR